MSRLTELRTVLHRCGIRGVVAAVGARLRGSTVGFDDRVSQVLTGARVLEVGGPSALFRSDNLVPSYGRAASIDNVNYTGATLWESGLRDGGDYAPEGHRLGTQWLREASDLGDVGPYDVVISSHTIEHTADPLRALREWLRVTRDGGALVLVVPHRDGTFDHRRPLTTIEHLRDDEARAVDEADDTHVDEILRLHDVDRDPGLASHTQLRERVDQNLSTRSMHHHVFDTRTVWEMVTEVGWRPVEVEAVWPHDIVLLAFKGGEQLPLGSFRSPFPTDRRSRRG